MTTFTPHKPEEMVVVKITRREAGLLTKLRRSAFGQFLVHKANGLIIRVEIQDSQVIDDSAEFDLK